MREREGGSELILTLLEGGTYLIFPLVKLILGPPFLIIIAQSLIQKVTIYFPDMITASQFYRWRTRFSGVRGNLAVSMVTRTGNLPVPVHGVS